jgi:UDP-N-acetylglucosamine diphosphorylase / glucose-1-phosphate thymidylyltransferase / UDP-N-acetylgalactosamine diphosphorylase / glucosamine-1-phosphate N-acetyltransferase / galactosamine-1-phosphate N-acetyltransferase
VTDLYLYDDEIARFFEPFSLTRPTSELRAGALLLRERWEFALKMKASGVICAAHLESFDEPWGARPASAGVIPSGSIIANSRCAVPLGPIQAGEVWRCGDQLAAVVLHRDVDVDEFERGRLGLDQLTHAGARVVVIQGWWMNHVWDFIAHLPAMLSDDIAALIANRTYKGSPIAGATGGGAYVAFAEDGATIEPHVHVDVSAGPVLLRRGATIQSFTRLAGPCLVGPDSIVGIDRVSGSSIGENCRVHGELASSILLGHANKNHDGFVGHSYLGRWSNLGAGTITSNLKNTYGSVQLWTPVGERETGLQFLGTLFGDHAKTGIGTPLTTGTVIGAGANVYGSVSPPKVVPPFAWGDRPPYSTYRSEKFVEVARRVMARRHVNLSASQARQLATAHERRWKTEAEGGGRKAEA